MPFAGLVSSTMNKRKADGKRTDITYFWMKIKNIFKKIW